MLKAPRKTIKLKNTHAEEASSILFTISPVKVGYVFVSGQIAMGFLPTTAVKLFDYGGRVHSM